MSIRGQRGFTLVEVLVSTAVIGMMVTLVGVGVNQAITLSERANYGSQAQRQTRNALHWMTRDMAMAQTTNVVDGAAPVSSATFTWTDVFADALTNHSLSYVVTNGELRRTYDGVTITIGRQITSLSFSRAGRLMTATINAQPNNRFQQTDQKTLTVMLRGNG